MSGGRLPNSVEQIAKAQLDRVLNVGGCIRRELHHSYHHIRHIEWRMEPIVAHFYIRLLANDDRFDTL